MATYRRRLQDGEGEIVQAWRFAYGQDIPDVFDGLDWNPDCLLQPDTVFGATILLVQGEFVCLQEGDWLILTGGRGWELERAMFFPQMFDEVSVGAAGNGEVSAG